jgi:hypothetical protein
VQKGSRAGSAFGVDEDVDVDVVVDLDGDV